jgi:hypothetical protein
MELIVSASCRTCLFIGCVDPRIHASNVRNADRGPRGSRREIITRRRQRAVKGGSAAGGPKIGADRVVPIGLQRLLDDDGARAVELFCARHSGQAQRFFGGSANAEGSKTKALPSNALSSEVSGASGAKADLSESNCCASCPGQSGCERAGRQQCAKYVGSHFRNPHRSVFRAFPSRNVQRQPVKQWLRLPWNFGEAVERLLSFLRQRQRAAIAQLMCSTSASRRPSSRSRSAPLLHSAVTARAFTTSRK